MLKKYKLSFLLRNVGGGEKSTPILKLQQQPEPDNEYSKMRTRCLGFILGARFADGY